MDRAVAAARTVFDEGPWPRLTHAAARRVPTAFAAGAQRPRRRPRRHLAAPVRALHKIARRPARVPPARLDCTRRWPTRSRSRSRRTPTAGGRFGLLVREPVGVVGAIIPWNAPHRPDRVQGRSGAPRGLHRRAEGVARGAGRGLRCRRDRRGDRPAARRAQRASPPIARCPSCWCATRASTRSPSPGRPPRAGASRRSAASASPAAPSSSAASRPPSILDDMDLDAAAKTLAGAECFLSGQVCSSLTRIVVTPQPPRRAGRRARRQHSPR